MTPHGLLKWQITVRDDGQRLFDGCLPTLIQWGEVHPADNMAPSGVTLQSLRLTHPMAAELRAGLVTIEAHGIEVAQGPADMVAVLDTPRGEVTLASKGL